MTVLFFTETFPWGRVFDRYAYRYAVEDVGRYLPIVFTGPLDGDSHIDDDAAIDPKTWAVK